MQPFDPSDVNQQLRVDLANATASYDLMFSKYEAERIRRENLASANEMVGAALQRANESLAAERQKTQRLGELVRQVALIASQGGPKSEEEEALLASALEAAK